MSKIVVGFMTDAHHSNSSKELFGVFSTKEKAVEAIRTLDSNDQDLNDNDYRMIELHNQTQGHTCNYALQHIAIDELLIQP